MKKIVFVIVIMFLVFLSSCKLLLFTQQKTTDYMYGTEGIVINPIGLREDNKYFHGDYLYMALEIANKGAYNFPEGKIYLSGYDKSAITLPESIEIPRLEGKSEYMPEGEANMITLEEETTVKVPYGSSYKPNLMISSCYNYQTKATMAACVIGKYEDLIKGSVSCKPSLTSFDSQGAPVAVASVEERLTQDKIQYVITIENKGDGKAIKKDKLDVCPFSLGLQDIDEVEINVDISALGEAECMNNNKIKLIDGVGRAICIIEFSGEESSYTTEMVITLDYGYSSSITRQLEILNPLYITGEQK